jgi:hypothetical protein
MDANTALMTKIRAEWGDTIVLACASSSVPPSFVGALVANESGGDASAKRFERGVLDSLWEVLLGRTPAYGSLDRDKLLGFLCPPSSLGDIAIDTPANDAPFTGDARAVVSDSMQRLDGLATSWGLTQVMGYEAIAFHLDGVQRLQDPAGELPITLRMLADFASRFGLDLTAGTDAAASALFDCWNSGRPHAPTADPQYIPRGLARMKIYAGFSPATAVGG